MSGGAGNDLFYLGAGDRALGGDGNDQFFVSTGGNNLLSGGAGADIFNIVMAGTIPTGVNTILDFQVGTDSLGLKGLGTGFGFANLTRSGNNIAKVNFPALSGRAASTLPLLFKSLKYGVIAYHVT
jgi:Ca2+-binding RTX toxin-like protein